METNWPNNAQSPVLFFIDDLCNKWVDLNGDAIIQLEEDWGYAGLDENGVYRFLEREILSEFPEVKITFFVPVGKRADIITNSNIQSYSYPINATQKSRDFFNYIHNKTQHELAYHGLTHGTPGKETKDFVQEWEGFNSLKEALEVTKQGMEIFKDTVGEYPKGGKYCGYRSNKFSDESISKSGFQWWCRYYNKGIEYGIDKWFTGEDTNSMTNYNVKVFKNTIDIPTTLPGNFFNYSETRNPIKKIKSRIVSKKIMKKKFEYIDFLLENKLVISIQEHISSSREDGKRQTPNIFDDFCNFKKILTYLKSKNVWFCTGGELAEWSMKYK